MKELTVDLGTRSYSIVIGTGILGRIDERIREFRFSEKSAIISNPTVYSLYGEQLRKAVESAGLDPITILIPDGEEYKDYFWSYHILSKLLEAGLDRRSVIFALGGGVIGDITGFVASTYMRGISCIQVPTTLLSQVDSSVGGKTGVNHPLGKNMIGTFYQPSLVWIDVETLKTLPPREFLAGMAEVIKYGIIRDKGLFNYLDRHSEEIRALDPEHLMNIIYRSCEIKAEVVSQDEREAGLRAILNFGHTIGHAIETITNYRRFLHGEAVAIGMVYEAKLANKKGLIKEYTVKKIRSLIKKYNLPYRLDFPYHRSDIFRAMAIDKKAVSGRLRFVLPLEIGRVTIASDIPKSLLQGLFQ